MKQYLSYPCVTPPTLPRDTRFILLGTLATLFTVACAVLALKTLPQLRALYQGLEAVPPSSATAAAWFLSLSPLPLLLIWDRWYCSLRRERLRRGLLQLFGVVCLSDAVALSLLFSIYLPTMGALGIP